MDGVTGLLPVPYSMFKSSGQVPRRGDELLSGRFACYNLYRASDDRWVSVAALETKFWECLCRELSRPELIPAQFTLDQEMVKSKLASIFVTDTAHNWFERLRHKDCCVAPVRTIDEVHQDPHFASHPIGIGPKLGATPAAYRTSAPELGEHTALVLAELGYTHEQVKRLKQSGIAA